MKDATVSSRAELDIKEEAEGILQRLGIPVSVVINSFYRQIEAFFGGSDDNCCKLEAKILESNYFLCYAEER